MGERFNSLWVMGFLLFAAGFLHGAPRTVYIDPIGNDAPANWWNDLNFAAQGNAATLVDSQTNSTGITTLVTTAIQSSNGNGSTTPSGAAAEFVYAGGNSAYGNAAAFSAGVYPYGEVVFSNLTANVAYHFTFYASRIGAGGDNREALYTVTGSNSGSNTLNASENSSQVVAVSNIYPRANGTVTFRFEKGPNNNNAYGFFYLSAMKIAYEPPKTHSVYIDPMPVSGDASQTTAWWNSVNFGVLGSAASLVDSQTNATGIRATVSVRVQGPNGSATASPTGDAAEFAAVGSNNAYGNTADFGGTYPYGEVIFSNLSSSVAYQFTFYGSRMDVSDNREALYTVTGANSGSNRLNAANNSSQVTTVSNVYPRADGTITLRMEKGPNNSNGTGFFYLAAMKITYVESPVKPTAVFVDAAGSAAAAGWNLVNFNGITTNVSLTATNGVDTGIRMRVATRLNSALNSSATGALIGDAAEFAPAGSDNAFGNIQAFNGETNTYGVAIFSGLATNTAFNFTFFASRMGVTDNREARYIVTGANSGSNTLDASSNTSKVATVSSIYAAADGTITLRLEKGPNNNNDTGFFYLNSFKLTYTGVATNGTGGNSGGSTNSTVISGKRLLFFGNSFSQVDDVPGHVGSLATIAGQTTPLVVADLMGGQNLAYHSTQVDQYPTSNVASEALTGTNTWDFVVIQGYSTEATHIGDPLAFRTNALSLFQKVRYHASGKGAGVKAVLYETWARATGNADFYPGLFANPAAMQLEIRTNYQAVAESIAAAEGTTNAVRTAPVGDAFERDGFNATDLYASDLYHAGNLGPKLAALIIYKTIYNTTVTNIPYAAVYTNGWTTMSSNDWTRVTYWAEGLTPPVSNVVTAAPPAFGYHEVFLIDTANNDASAAGWNNISFNGLGAAAQLVLTNGYQTAASCTVITNMNGVNGDATNAPYGAASVFATAGANGAFGNTGTNFNTISAPVCLARLSGLSKARRYTFTFYGSRMNALDNRETLYTVEGANSGSGVLDCANNASQVAVVKDILPKSDGTIDVEIKAGPNNNNVFGFYYLSAMRIESVRNGMLILIGH